MKKIFYYLILSITLINCRGTEYIVEKEETEIGDTKTTAIKGFYLLNEGVMGSNKASLDFYDYDTGTYHRNIYADANPNVVKELGDVGNDIKTYGGKIYAVINVSNKIEVMDAKTIKKITTIPLQNCRYLTFNNGKIYASSYAGPVEFSENSPKGKVVEIDTTSLSITREATVGYQPEQLTIVGNELFVANSGGYRFPNYDNTISVIDLNSFTETKKIEVAINLHQMQKNNDTDLYVSSRGDYYTIPSNLFLIDAKTKKLKKDFGIPVSGMVVVKDKLYFYSNQFNYNTGKSTKNFGVIDTKTQQILSTDLIETEYLNEIQTPYGISVNPLTEDIYITDARNYVSTGYLYCFDKNGKFKWKTEAGNIPAHFAFLYK